MGHLARWDLPKVTNGLAKTKNRWVPSQKDQTGTNEGHQSATNVGNQSKHEQDDQGIENPTEQVVDATYGAGASARNAKKYVMHALVGYEPPIVGFLCHSLKG